MTEPSGLVVDVRAKRGAFALHATFEIGREVVSVIGPNGAGKTSLLLTILGLLPADEGYIACCGRVLFDGQRGRDLPVEQREVAYLPQDHGLLPHMSALDNVAFALTCRSLGRNRRERWETARAALARAGADGLAGRYPSEISGGERQRVALARALVSTRSALLCDEPLSAVSADARERMRSLLLEVARTLDVPTLVVSHLPEDVLAVGGRVLVIEGGQILACAPPAELQARPPSPFVARFFSARA